MCLEKKRKEKLDFTHHNLPICSGKCCIFFEMHGLERFIRYQESSFDWYDNEIGLLYDELGVGITYSETDNEFEPREDEEIMKDIDNLKEELSILKKQIKELKKHPDVRLAFLFDK
ncbi:hypothetical protein [Bacillus cereus]|uniref:hypothetical protein n=1 Tax=Bacillus cereus TaxID=1396 RepID=UPI0018A70D5A|nr:hypothetical protein [Bacillus cereus]MBF8118139.1 hypothetical protein [Bacillus cereus]